MAKLQKCLFVESISLYIETGSVYICYTYTSVYVFTLRCFLCGARYIRRDDDADRSCTLIDNLALVRRDERKREKQEGERKRENDRHFVLYIFSGNFTSDYFRILHTKLRCLSDRSARRNISFAKVCAKRESSLFNKFLGGEYFTHSKSLTFHVDLGMAVFAV